MNKALVIILIVILLIVGIFLINNTDIKQAFTGANGKIISEEILENWVGKSQYPQIDVYKIRYLSDGLEVAGYIVRPKQEGKYPVIIFNRGGYEEGAKLSLVRLENLPYLASQGYVVLASQYRGNDGGEGKDTFGGEDVNDILNLISLGKELPYTKADEIFMYGVSRGGMMTYLAIKQGADIRAAVINCGYTDLIQEYEEKDDSRKRVLEERIGGSPEQCLDEYKNRSAYYWAEEIDKPILILHGEKDPVIDVSQAKKLAERLEELGTVDYELIIVPNGNHGIGYQQDEVNNYIIEWFKKHSK